MTGFLGEIGEKLADRWAALVAVPGLLYLAAVAVAAILGQAHALSYASLSRKVTVWTASPVLKSVGGAVLIVVAVLAGSLVAGLLAAAGGRFVETLWTLPGRRPPASWLARRRRDRSRRQKAIADSPSASPAQVRRAIARADRICLVEAGSPTWIGDRLRACRVRIDTVYGLDLDAAWPRLWLIVPDSVRTELGAARDAFGSAARLAAWAVLYLVLAIWWWPALPVAVLTGATAVGQGRLAARNLADLIEAAVDLYSGALAAELGEQAGGPAVGVMLTAPMRKNRSDPGSPLADYDDRHGPLRPVAAVRYDQEGIASRGRGGVRAFHGPGTAHSGAGTG